MMVESYRAGNLAPEGMLRSIQHWIANGLVPFWMTRNKPSPDLSGKNLLLLIIFKLIWPLANYCECVLFIANESDDAHIFLEQDVGLSLRKLGYTQTITSMVAYPVFTQVNLDHQCLFWTQPWPVDKFGLHLNVANRTYGSAPIGLKIRKPGNYNRGAFKLAIILAVEMGDPDIPDGDIGSVSNP